MKRTSFFVAFGMSLSSSNGHTKCSQLERKVYLYYVLHSRYIWEEREIDFVMDYSVKWGIVLQIGIISHDFTGVRRLLVTQWSLLWPTNKDRNKHLNILTGLRIPTGRSPKQLAVYKHDQGVELGSTEKKSNYLIRHETFKGSNFCDISSDPQK